MSQRDAHESYAVAAGRLHWIALILALSLTGVVAVMYLLFRFLLHDGQAVSNGQLPPQPRLQAHPGGDLAAERAREEARLNAYGWNDGNHTVAHVPINRAMHLMVQHGNARARGASP